MLPAGPTTWTGFIRPGWLLIGLPALTWRRAWLLIRAKDQPVALVLADTGQDFISRGGKLGSIAGFFAFAGSVRLGRRAVMLPAGPTTWTGFIRSGLLVIGLPFLTGRRRAWLLIRAKDQPVALVLADAGQDFTPGGGKLGSVTDFFAFAGSVRLGRRAVMLSAGPTTWT